MTPPWGETNVESYADESSYGESSFSESYDPSGESEWDSPFAATEAEDESTLEYGQEYGQEAYAPDGSESEVEWESPFATPGLASDTEVDVLSSEFPNDCGDVRHLGQPWPFKGKPDPKNPGRASELTVVPRAEVFEFQLSKFDVDRYELKPEHRKPIENLTQRLLAGIKGGRYSGDPIRVFAYGEASSTAAVTHNLPLSRHRAFNTLNAIRCRLRNLGVSYPIIYGMYGTGEQHARVRGPDQKEEPQFRGVMVRAFAPLKDCDCKPPGPPPPTGTTTICVSVPKIAPRLTTRLPPDIIPLGPLVAGLRLPVAIVTKAQADVRVDARPGAQTGRYSFQGWGLEFALPAGRTRIDLQADLRASLEILVKASASLGARLNLGPLKLSLRVDLSVFAQLIVKLCAQLRARLDVDLGRPNLPELRQCQFIQARNARGPFPFAALSGPGVLIVPGAGYGPALLGLHGPGVAGLGIAANPIRVPADKSTVKTLLALGGNLQLVQASGGARREAEGETMLSEWPEAFEELQPELTPFA